MKVQDICRRKILIQTYKRGLLRNDFQFLNTYVAGIEPVKGLAPSSTKILSTTCWTCCKKREMCATKANLKFQATALDTTLCTVCVHILTGKSEMVRREFHIPTGVVRAGLCRKLHHESWKCVCTCVCTLRYRNKRRGTR